MQPFYDEFLRTFKTRQAYKTLKYMKILFNFQGFDGISILIYQKNEKFNIDFFLLLIIFISSKI